MSKIICDVCGTTYPETAAQCPICGSAKPENASVIETADQAAPKYTHVKGGRFSEKNVRKRNKEKLAAAKTYSQLRDDRDDEDEEEEQENSGSNRGLVITLILLLLAIAAVLLYLYFNYFAPNKENNPTDPVPGITTTASAEETEPDQTTTEHTLNCTGVTLTEKEITLSNAGDGYLLNYSLEPADTTDTPVFTSSNPDVATVDANGKITAVGPGSAVITVSCGDAQTNCTVTCNIVTEPPTEETTEPETEPVIEFKLNRSDITLKVGESWTLYTGEIGNTLITWRSSNNSVATVTNGKVTGVSAGKATIYAEYNGEEYKCVVYVKKAG